MEYPAVDLTGHPARVATPESGEEHGWQHGVVAAHDGTTLVIELLQPQMWRSYPPHILVEVLHTQGLCRAVMPIVPSSSSGAHLRLVAPPMQEWERLQRRRHPRVAAAAAAWISFGGRRWPATAVNLSVGGAALVSEAPCPLGAVVAVGFRMGQGLPLGPLSAEVARLSEERDRPAIGLMFLNLTESSRSLLSEYVGKRQGGWQP